MKKYIILSALIILNIVNEKNSWDKYCYSHYKDIDVCEFLWQKKVKNCLSGWISGEYNEENCPRFWESWTIEENTVNDLKN